MLDSVIIEGKSKIESEPWSPSLGAPALEPQPWSPNLLQLSQNQLKSFFAAKIKKEEEEGSNCSNNFF